jgi:hypothetical protein
MPVTPDAALFAALLAASPPAAGATELVLELTEEVRTVSGLLREASLALRAPPNAEQARHVAALLDAAQEAAQRQAERTAALLRHLAAGSEAA